MKIKRKIQLLALLLTVVFIGSLTACSCSGFDFSKIKYEGYDYAAIMKYFDEAEISIAKSTNANSAIMTANRASNYFQTITTQFQLIQLEYQLDNTDAFVSAEYVRVRSEYTEARGRIYKLFYIAHTNNSISEEFYRGNEDLRAAVIRFNSSNDAEYTQLLNDIAAIEKKYDELAGNTVLDYTDGITYTANNIYDKTRNYTAARRKEIYNAYYELYAGGAGDLLLELRDKYNELTDKKLVGYDSYADYAYEVEYSRDYTPAQARTMSGAVKQSFNGYYGMINDKRAAMQPPVSVSAVKTSSISSAVVSNNSSALKSYFNSISPNMKKAYEYMDKSNLYVTTSSQSSTEGAYTSYISEYGVPYIYQFVYNNTFTDITTFVHEFGHFYAYYRCGDTVIPLDIAEIQSQANEWLFVDSFKDISGFSGYSEYYELTQLLSSVYSSIQMGCIMDELQQEIYADKEGVIYTTGSDVTDLFESLLYEYGAYREDYTYDFKYWWSNVPHTFNSPFYYISYAVSMLPALELYKMADSNRSGAVSAYNTIIDMGDAFTYSEMLNEVSIPSPFNTSTISNLAAFTKSNWAL